ncbi:MAG TPA: nuclear transport factor 2 family protein [Candidatus Dormibacteraeota bacterium]|nr:nuclear transport factor 2 family protein [Candidatus Dormibacteraeota bacterium]
MTEPAGADAVALVEAFRTAQNRGDVEGCLGLLGDGAIFDIGTGRFEGARRIATLLRLLARIHYTTAGEPPVAGDAGLLTALWTVRHDDLRRNGLGELAVHAEIQVRGGAIVLLRTRPTAETLARLRAASGTTDPAAYQDPTSER